jgi:hypothetical protein
MSFANGKAKPEAESMLDFLKFLQVTLDLVSAHQISTFFPPTGPSAREHNSDDGCIAKTQAACDMQKSSGEFFVASDNPAHDLAFLDLAACKASPTHTSVMEMTSASSGSKSPAAGGKRGIRKPFCTSSFACGLVTSDSKPRGEGDAAKGRGEDKGRHWASLVDAISQVMTPSHRQKFEFAHSPGCGTSLHRLHPSSPLHPKKPQTATPQREKPSSAPT